MGAFALASLVIGLFGTLGAIHLLRMAVAAAEGSDDLTTASATPDSGALRCSAGGLGMLAGISIASFYMDPWPHSAKGLVYAAILLVIAGTWMERKGSLEHRPLVMAVCGLLGTLVSTWFALDYLDWNQVIWSVGFVLLLCAASLAPFATAMLPQSSRATPALPSLLVLIEVTLLLFFGAISAFEFERQVLFGEFAVVALPALGAILGSLTYVARLPWRARPAVLVGIGGHMALGLLVAWGVLRLGARSAGGTGATTALLWLVAVPFFELARGAIAWTLQRCLLDPLWGSWAGHAPALRRFVEGTGYSTASTCTFAIVFGLIGMGLWHLDVSGYWTTLGLLPAFALYLIGSTLVPYGASWSRGHAAVHPQVPRAE